MFFTYPTPCVSVEKNFLILSRTPVLHRRAPDPETLSMKRRTFLSLAGTIALAASSGLPALAQTAPIPVRVGVIPVIGTAPLFVAQAEGWLKDAGLSPTVTTFESGPNMIQALA